MNGLFTVFVFALFKYVHYEVDYSDVEKKKGEDRKPDEKVTTPPTYETVWIHWGGSREK